MALNNYTALQASIADWLNRSDLTAVIPDFITIAEFQMRRRIKAALSEGKPLPRAMVVNNPAFSIPANTEYVNLPSDFLGTLSFGIDPQTVNGVQVGAVQLDYAEPMNVEYLKQRRGVTATNSIPAMYSIVGAQFQFIPIPDYTYAGNLFYWGDFTNLVTAPGGVNWILTNHPDAYLYGALTASAPYLKEDPRAETWGTLFLNAIEDMLKADPIPNDRTRLHVESALTFRPNSSTTFNINTGDFGPGI